MDVDDPEGIDGDVKESAQKNDMKICGQCDFKYETIPQLMAHVKKAKDHSPLCVQCNNTKFSNFNNYRHHVRKFHMNFGDVICSECGKTSKTHEQQMLHWNFVHKEEEDLYCNICGTKCKNMFKLRKHTKKCLTKDFIVAARERREAEESELRCSQQTDMWTVEQFRIYQNSLEQKKVEDSVNKLKEKYKKERDNLKKKRKAEEPNGPTKKRPGPKREEDILYENNIVKDEVKEDTFNNFGQNKFDESDDDNRDPTYMYDNDFDNDNNYENIKDQKHEDYSSMQDIKNNIGDIFKDEGVKVEVDVDVDVDMKIKDEVESDVDPTENYQLGELSDHEDDYDYVPDTSDTLATATYDENKSPVKEEDHHEISNSKPLNEINLKDEKDEVPCPDCGKNIRRRYMSVHRKIHKGIATRAYVYDPTERPCPDCGKIIVGKGNLITHRKTHTKKKLCTICNEYVQDIRKHKREAHPDMIGDEKNLECLICKTTYKRLKYLRVHMRNSHGTNRVEKKSKLCPICAKETRNLSSHMRDSHPNEGEDNFNCNECDKSFQSKRYLRKHIDNCHRGKLICPYCSKLCSKSHINTAHKQQPSICDICSAEFKNKHALSGHKRKVHCEKGSFTCQDCFQVFDTHYKLYNHRYAVHNLQECKCEFCGGTYKNKKLLQVHKRVSHPDLYEASKNAKQMQEISEYATSMSQHILSSEQQML